MFYKFTGHTNGIGQDELVSAGYFGYGGSIDMYSSKGYFKLNRSPVVLGRVPEHVYKLLDLGGIKYALAEGLSAGGIVYQVPSSYSPPASPSFDPDVDATLLSPVYDERLASGLSINNVVNFNGIYYVIMSTAVKTATGIGTPAWIVTNFATGSFSGVCLNYLDGRLYIANNKQLAKIDEFGVFTDNILGRTFDSEIVGLSIIGSSLNVYQSNGTKSILDISSEAIVDSIDFKVNISSVISDNSIDYFVGRSDIGTAIYASSGYTCKKIIDTSISKTLGVYKGVAGDSLRVAPKNNSECLKSCNGKIFFIGESVSDEIFMRTQEGLLYPFISKDIAGNDFSGEVSCIEAQPDDSERKVLFAHDAGAQTHIYSTLLRRDMELACKRGFLMENTFTGGDITRRKEVTLTRTYAEVPEGTRLIVRAICDGLLTDCFTVEGGTGEVLHKHQIDLDGYKITFIYELENTRDFYTDVLKGASPEFYEMEIEFSFIEE